MSPGITLRTTTEPRPSQQQKSSPTLSHWRAVGQRRPCRESPTAEGLPPQHHDISGGHIEKYNETQYCPATKLSVAVWKGGRCPLTPLWVTEQVWTGPQLRRQCLHILPFLHQSRVKFRYILTLQTKCIVSIEKPMLQEGHYKSNIRDNQYSTVSYCYRNKLP